MGGMGDMGDMDDMGMGMGGYGGMAAGQSGKPAETNPVDYKLLRFYDFAYNPRLPPRSQDKGSPRLGRKYVYRIRYGVEDPNFPKDPAMQPQGNTLDPDAYQRVIALSADAVQNEKRDYVRWSDWSDPTEPVSLPTLDRSVVGNVKVDRVRKVKRGGRDVPVASTEPKAEVVASWFDPALGVFVPTLINATEGTVLSTKVESADVVDPITLEVKKTEEKVIKSAATIIDIDGGLPLGIVEDDEMVQPGLFLMMDGNGKLKISDAVEQQRFYRIKSFATERGL